MTERQAWLELAKMAEATAEMWERDPGKADREAPMWSGLCRALFFLNVGNADRTQMEARIWRQVDRTTGRSGYGWPLSPSGYRARAAFCKRQIARIDRERRRGKKK